MDINEDTWFKLIIFKDICYHNAELVMTTLCLTAQQLVSTVSRHYTESPSKAFHLDYGL